MQECAGLLPGSTAEAISDHIQETWARARRAIECLRAKLGDRADELVPLERGGMRLFRIQALMGDGCATQKKVSRLMEKLKKEDGEEMYGAEWNSMDNTITKVLVDVCANHSRNYPIDEWNRKFEKILSSTLSEDFNTCIEQSGPMARLEKNGTSFLRSFVKLVYGGRGAYEKGEGQRHCLFHFQCFILWLNILYYLFIGRTGRDINLWLEDNYPELVRNRVGRVEWENGRTGHWENGRTLFGDAIQESFARNIADRLEANGRLANSKLSEPDKKPQGRIALS